MKIGRTAFKKLKPENVKIVTETSRRTCLCTICCCYSPKLEGMHRFTAVTESPPGDLKKLSKMSKSEINNAIMCAHPNGSLPNMPCDNRACKNCEMKPVELLQPLADYRDESLKWYAWEYVWLLKKGEKKRIMSCVEKMTTVANRPRKLRLNKIQ